MKKIQKMLILTFLFISLVFYGGQFRVEKAQASLFSSATDFYNNTMSTVQGKIDQYNQANDRVEQYKNDAQIYKENAQVLKDEAIKLKNKLTKKKTPAASTTGTSTGLITGTGAIGLAAYPQLMKEEQQLKVKYDVKNEKAKSFYLAVSKPNSNLSLSKATACQIVKSASALTAENGLYAKRYQNCTLGSCKDTFDYLLPKTALDKNYKIKVTAFVTSDEGEENCSSANIIDLSQQEITVEKIPVASTSATSSAENKIKGSIRITSPSSINNGNTVLISVNLKNHKNDEMMLWITDCDGTLVPKIDINDHQGRTVPSDPYSYKYAWDTQAAQTKACKHTVQVKTFTKDSLGNWSWNDQAQYQITVGDNKAQSELICIMQIDSFTADQGDQNPAQATTVDNKVTVKSGKVKIKWNGVCGAKYYIYRDDQLLGTTTDSTFEDTLDSTGEYKYRVEAYITKSDLNGPADQPSGGANNYDPNLSWNRLIKNAIVIGLIDTVQAGDETKVSTKELVVNYKSIYEGATGSGGKPTVCASDKIQLGMPIPVSEGGIHLKYCAENLADYMTAIYNLLITIASLSAVIMIILGGYMYISSVGDATKINTAKEMIIGALVGLALLLSAGFIIQTIGIPT